MTQRIFDVNNEQDMKDLWAILPEKVGKLKKDSSKDTIYYESCFDGKTIYYLTDLISINWHDKTEITRPIEEASEADYGKLCKFWDDDSFETFNILQKISTERGDYRYQTKQNTLYKHCRRLTKQEIEELC